MKKIFVIIAVAALALASVACNQEQLDDLQGRVEALENDRTIDDLKTKVSEMEKARQSLETAIAAALTESDLSPVKSDIEALQSASATMKSQLEAAAKASELKTLSETVASLQTTVSGIETTMAGIQAQAGKIPGIESAISGLQSSVSACSSTLESLASQLGALSDKVNALIDAVQSVSIIPDYGDGSIKVTDLAEVRLQCAVSPASASSRIAAAGKDVCKLDAIFTAVKSDSRFVDLAVTAVKESEPGLIELIADMSAFAGCEEDLKLARIGASVRLSFTDGDIMKSSPFAPLYFQIVRVESVHFDAEEYGAGLEYGSIALKATVLPADATEKTVIWSCDKPELATISKDGVLSYTGEGTVCVTARTLDGGFEASCNVVIEKMARTLTWPGQELSAGYRMGHPAFSPDKLKAYVASDNGTLIAIDLATASVDWTYRHPDCGANTSQPCGSVTVNPQTGDVFFTDRTTASYCVAKDGTLKWKVDIPALGTAFAFNSDCSIIFIAGNSCAALHPDKTAGSRYLGAFNANTGEELAFKYANDELDGITGALTYTGYAQMLVTADDRVILWGAEHYCAYSFTQENGVYKFTRIAYTKTNASQTNYGKAQDFSNPVVPPDKKKAYFATQSGKLAIVNLETFQIEGAADIFYSNGIGQLYSPVLDSEGFIYVANSAAKVYKFALDDIVAGAKPTPVFTATVEGTSGTCLYGVTPCPMSDGTLLYASGTGPNIASMFLIPAKATGNDVFASLFVKTPFSTETFTGIFAATDNYAVAATGNQYKTGRIYVVKTYKTVASDTWAYYGGDPCATHNVKLVYGSY